VAALFLFWRVARRMLGVVALLGALLLFAVSPSLIWYGGNVKQYAGDVAISLLLVLIALRFDQRPDDRVRAITGGIVGAAAMPLSYASVPTAGVLGAILAWRWLHRRPRSDRVALIGLGAPWLVGAALCGILALKLIDPETQAYMNRYWAEGFVPVPWKDTGALLWVPRHLYDALGNLLLFVVTDSVPGRVYVFVSAAFAVVGLTALFKNSPGRAALVLAPVIAAVLAAAGRLLPFQSRVGLYAGWPLLIAAMAGVEALHVLALGRARWAVIGLGVSIAAFPAVFILAVTGHPPYRAQEARPVLAEVARRWRPGDELFVYYGARWAMNFYGRQFGMRGWIGECHREDPRAYFREADRFRGRPRVWFFYTHSALGYREPQVIRSYFETIGVERDRIPDPYGLKGQREAAAYLYDLSEETRLAATTADAYQHPEVATGDLRILCDGTRLEAR
jgi:hypothetical protein